MSAGAILEHLEEGRALTEDFSREFRSKYQISGRPIAEWEREFKIKLPDDLNPAIIRALGLYLIELNQQATFQRALAASVHTSLQKAYDSQYRDQFTKLVDDYKAKGEKLPAAPTLASLTEAVVDNLESAVEAAKVAAGFWSEVLEHLSFCRKVLDTATVALGVEAKIASGER